MPRISRTDCKYLSVLWMVTEEVVIKQQIINNYSKYIIQWIHLQGFSVQAKSVSFCDLRKMQWYYLLWYIKKIYVPYNGDCGSFMDYTFITIESYIVQLMFCSININLHIVLSSIKLFRFFKNLIHYTFFILNVDKLSRLYPWVIDWN